MVIDVIKRRHLIILVLAVILVSGCSNNVSVKNNKKNDKDKITQTEKRVIDKMSFTYKWDCEVPLNKIKDISTVGMNFISDDGALYEFNLDKKYSTTGSHCRKVNIDVSFEKFINNGIISSDKKVYLQKGENYVDISNEERRQGWVMGFPYDLYDYNENIIILNMDLDINLKYGIVEDNKVYENGTGTFSSDYIGKGKELYTFSDGETLVGIYGSYIKTNKAYYVYGVTNKNECEKYADIECEYGIVKDKTLSDAYDEIYYMNNYYLIMKSDYNKLYTGVYER